MIDWIKSLLDSKSDDPRPSVADQKLLAELNDQLKECEALYRAGAYLCTKTCPERIDRDPESFRELMLDLHRGLLVKVFFEIARCDRKWHAAEREAALILLNHVWGVDVTKDNLARVLRNVADLEKTLEWKSLLGPFVRFPPLNDQVPELHSNIIRIANLVAKADGKVLPSEVRGLRSIESAIEAVLDRRDTDATSRQIRVALAGQEATQIAKTKKAGRRAKRRVASRPDDVTEEDRKSREEMLAEAMGELNQLIGLDTVKTDIRHLANFLKIEKERARHDLPQTQISLHTIFRGNPGTGKTTVARILARIFGGLGILEKGHTIETDRSGLVAGYAGQTGPKVNDRVDEALDGILFVDEAYSLVAESGDDPFGTEAVQVLLKRMEDDRARLVAVLAGYPDPMDRMLRSNPGLSSRFQRTFDFNDYTTDELVQIFQAMCRKNHYALPESAENKLRSVFQVQVDRRDKHFGNGRLARNIFEQAIRRMANRIVEIAPLTRKLLTTLHADDIEMIDMPGLT